MSYLVLIFASIFRYFVEYNNLTKPNEKQFLLSNSSINVIFLILALFIIEFLDIFTMIGGTVGFTALLTVALYDHWIMKNLKKIKKM